MKRKHYNAYGLEVSRRKIQFYVEITELLISYLLLLHLCRKLPETHSHYKKNVIEEDGIAVHIWELMYVS